MNEPDSGKVLRDLMGKIQEMREGYIRLELDVSLDEATEIVSLLKKLRQGKNEE